MYRYESWIIKKDEHRRTDTFELWYWRRLFQFSRLGLVEAGQDEIDQVERKGLRLDNRKDLALRSASFRFQINSHRKRQWPEHRAYFRRYVLHFLNSQETQTG